MPGGPLRWSILSIDDWESIPGWSVSCTLTNHLLNPGHFPGTRTYTHSNLK
jgi:hypothetical protein